MGVEMLSTVHSVDPSPAPVFSTTGRPPDTGQTHNAPSDIVVVASPPKEPSSRTAMLVDSSAGHAVSGEISAAAVANANASNQLTLTTPPFPQTSTAHTHPSSYAGVLIGGQLVPMSQSLATQWTPVGEHDLIPGERNGEPALNISSEFKNRLCAPWHRTLVIRLLGIKIGFHTLCSRLRALWRPTGAMEIRDLDEASFLVKLNNDQDYFKALTDGPWMIFDHYIAVQQWTPRFKVSDPLPRKMIVWVHLPELKIHFYHKEVLTSLGNLIGRTIKLDYHTLTQQRAKFARLAVEVDISKPLVPRIWLDDDWQPVEYENLPVVCFECGKIGHASSVCPLLRPTSTTEVNVLAGGENPDPSSEGTPETKAGFGPWMLVSRKGRRNQRETNSKGKQKDSGASPQAIKTRYGKNGQKSKESREPLPFLDQQNSPSPQRSAGQERKANGEGFFGADKRKGKGILREEETNTGKGLLGPGPTAGSMVKKGPKPNAETSKASTSNSFAEPILDSDSAPSRGISLGPQAQGDQPRPTFSPPPTSVTTGPNGTVMQVVQVSPLIEAPPRRTEQVPPKFLGIPWLITWKNPHSDDASLISSTIFFRLSGICGWEGEVWIVGGRRRWSVVHEVIRWDVEDARHLSLSDPAVD
ncbi:unnamed protein product [Linum tenue]|uniref:CCHC-type domain-containing protein n=1 Tax=Linum tenue TaxID=586396 RepID=A0AAV0N4B9_9ROSI|nr:unnamed protein product [Linum tenue]